MVRIFQIEDFEFKVGSSARENWEIVKAAQPQDLWFHLDSVSSASGILSHPSNIKIPKNVFSQAKLIFQSLQNKQGKIITRKRSQITLGDKVGTFNI